MKVLPEETDAIMILNTLKHTLSELKTSSLAFTSCKVWLNVDPNRDSLRKLITPVRCGL